MSDRLQPGAYRRGGQKGSEGRVDLVDRDRFCHRMAEWLKGSPVQLSARYIKPEGQGVG